MMKRIKQLINSIKVKLGIYKQDYHYTIEVYKTRNKQWSWRLVAPNGRIIAVAGESYIHKTKCLRSLQKTRENLPIAEEKHVSD